MSDPRRFDGALIDLYGTLVPIAPTVARGPHLREMAGLLGVDPARFERDWSTSFPERIVGALGDLEATVRSIAGRQGVDPSAAQLRAAVDRRLQFTRMQFDRCGPVLVGLDRLRAAGLRLALVSNATDDSTRVWEQSPLRERFDAVVFSCAEGLCKPDPRIYRRALERLNLRAERCAFVGDGDSHELSGARAVGLAPFRFQFPSDRGQPDARFDPERSWDGEALDDLADLLAGPSGTDP